MKYLYKRFFQENFKPPSAMSDLEWFALEGGYGSSDTYGPIVKTYEVKKPLTLINLGHGLTREKIIKELSAHEEEIEKYIDPDYQYSGGRYNAKLHALLRIYYGNRYDGTIIDEKDLVSGGRFEASDMEGASEVVLWKNFPKLLRAL